MNYTHRYIAKLTVEAETPISVGSGEKGLTTDRLVAKDANGLPYIPGTGIAGVLRHSFPNKDLIEEIFGSDSSDGKGSRLIVSSACLVGEDGKKIIEGLRNIDTNSGYYSYFSRLPERDHVRMTDKGVADTANHGKYDEELVHKGTRFVFELELIGDDADRTTNWEQLIKTFASPVFRIGAGTRKGFGKLKIIKELSKTKIFNLRKTEDLRSYLKKSSSLNEPIQGWDLLPELDDKNEIEGWEKHVLKIISKDFFLFGAGFGDDDADNKPKTEKYFDWESGKPELTEQEFLLIPGTSLKGIIAHRVAYHYNKNKNIEIGNASKISLESTLDLETATKEFDEKFNINAANFNSNSDEWQQLENEINAINIEGLNAWTKFTKNLDDEVLIKKENSLPVGENNEAVKALFGYAKNSDKDDEGLRGRVIINDIYLPYNPKEDKVFNHTKIDRFTNGTIDGALFQEKAAQYKNEINLEIWVDKAAFQNDKLIEKAFNQTLIDLTEGNLQLGGNTTKGHGVFTGTIN